MKKRLDSRRGGVDPAHRHAPSLRVVLAVLVAAASVTAALSSCVTPSATHAAPTTNNATHDPPTRAALLHIAQRFNNAYDTGKFGAVWDRWDQRSRAIISRAAYIRRHRECAPASGARATVVGAERVSNRTWHVRYRIDGVHLVDTWHYRHGRWVFDIIDSNPRAARQYAMPFAKYAAAVGCTVH